MGEIRQSKIVFCLFEMYKQIFVILQYRHIWSLYHNMSNKHYFNASPDTIYSTLSKSHYRYARLNTNLYRCTILACSYSEMSCEIDNIVLLQLCFLVSKYNVCLCLLLSAQRSLNWLRNFAKWIRIHWNVESKSVRHLAFNFP